MIVLFSLFELAFVFALFASTIYFVYRSFRMAFWHLGEVASLDDPWPVFVAAWWGALVWCLFAWALAVLILPTIVPIPIILITGFVWLVVDAKAYFFAQDSVRTHEQRHPPPRLQFRTTDLVLATAVFGLSMACLAAPNPYQEPEALTVVMVALYLLPAQAFGFFVAMDVLRRTKRLRRPVPRALLVAGLMLYSTLLVPLTLMTWCAWRHALWRLHRTPPAPPPANPPEPPPPLPSYPEPEPEDPARPG